VSEDVRGSPPCALIRPGPSEREVLEVVYTAHAHRLVVTADAEHQRGLDGALDDALLCP
jgi:hypothetical protein